MPYIEPKFYIVKYKLFNGKFRFDHFMGKFISSTAAKLECDALREAYYPHCETTGKAVFRVEYEDEENENSDFIEIH